MSSVFSPFPLLKRYVVLLTLSKCLDYNDQRFSQMEVKLKKVYVLWFGQIQDQVWKDFIRVKAELKRNSISIEHEKVSKSGVEVQFRHRGYADTYSIWVEYLHAEVQETLKKYVHLCSS